MMEFMPDGRTRADEPYWLLKYSEDETQHGRIVWRDEGNGHRFVLLGVLGTQTLEQMEITAEGFRRARTWHLAAISRTEMTATPHEEGATMAMRRDSKNIGSYELTKAEYETLRTWAGKDRPA